MNRASGVDLHNPQLRFWACVRQHFVQRFCMQGRNNRVFIAIAVVDDHDCL